MGKGSFRPFVVLYGNEDFLLDRQVLKIKQGSRRVLFMDAASSDLTDRYVIDQCRYTRDEPITVLVDNAQEISGSKALREYIDDKSLTDTSVVLIAIVRGVTKLPAIWEHASHKGTKPAAFMAFKTWDQDRFTDFISREVTSFGVEIKSDVAEMLLAYVGPDLRLLHNEIQKLANMLGGSGQVLKTHLASLVTRSDHVDKFKVIDAILSRNRTSMMLHFGAYYSIVGDSGLVGLVRLLMSQVERFVLIRSLQSNGMSNDELGELLEMRGFILKKAIANANQFELSELLAYMKLLCDLDSNVMFSSAKRTLVEMALLSMTA